MDINSNANLGVPPPTTVWNGWRAYVGIDGEYEHNILRQYILIKTQPDVATVVGGGAEPP
jgi:hypothetical protein